MRLYVMDCNSCGEIPGDLSVKKKKMSLFSLSVEGEAASLKTCVGRAFFYLIARGQFWIYYVTDGETGQLVHTSYVSGRSFKFPFMSKGDIHIGPCRTAPSHRGQGIYGRVLRVICGDSKNRAYMMVHEENLPSIKGIEAAGFRQIGTVAKTGICKVYRRTDHD